MHCEEKSKVQNFACVGKEESMCLLAGHGRLNCILPEATSDS